MNRPRVLLAEDHAETAERLRKLLGTDFDVIAWVEDGGALVDAEARLSPDVTVADIAMPRLDGIAAATVIRRNNPDARIVLVTVHTESMLVEAGLAAGALGYVLKDMAGDDLVAAIHAALDGRRYVSRALGDVADDPTQDPDGSVVNRRIVVVFTTVFRRDRGDRRAFRSNAPVLPRLPGQPNRGTASATDAPPTHVFHSTSASRWRRHALWVGTG